MHAIHAAARGRRYLSSGIAQGMALSGFDDDHSPFDVLSARELEVAMLLVRGLRPEDIARRLSLRAKTINTHKSRLFDKPGIRDSLAPARRAGLYGLPEPPTAPGFCS